MKVFYASNDVFRVSVRDIDLKRILYPYLPTRLSLDVHVINISSSESFSDRDFSGHIFLNEVEAFQAENPILDRETVDSLAARIHGRVGDDVCDADASDARDLTVKNEICFGPFGPLAFGSNSVWNNSACPGKLCGNEGDASVMGQALQIGSPADGTRECGSE